MNCRRAFLSYFISLSTCHCKIISPLLWICHWSLLLLTLGTRSLQKVTVTLANPKSDVLTFLREAIPSFAQLPSWALTAKLTHRDSWCHTDNKWFRLIRTLYPVLGKDVEQKIRRRIEIIISTNPEQILIVKSFQVKLSWFICFAEGKKPLKYFLGDRLAGRDSTKLVYLRENRT